MVDIQFQNIFENLPSGMLVMELSGKVIFLNHAAETMIQVKASEVIGRDFDDVFGLNYFQNSAVTFNCLRNTCKPIEFETHIQKNGGKMLPIEISASPVRTSNGKKVAIALIIQDISRIKKMEEKANRAGRLAAMGEMAAKIAHEIRNPLGSIELFASVLKNDLEKFQELRTLAEHISRGVQNINNIISNLLLFIRPDQQIKMQIIDLHAALRDSLLFAGHMLDGNNTICVTMDFSSKPIKILGDSELLKQVVLNLILNAIQAMPNGGTLTIATRVINGQDGKKLAELKVTDTGCGIPAGDLPNIFDPFFTTKKRGTGLGLAIVHNIINAHGGNIDITSCESEGTECIITLPTRRPNSEHVSKAVGFAL